VRDILANIAGFFERLQPRERLFVTVGVALVLIVVLVKAVLPQWQTYNQLAQQQQTFEADLLWLQEQRDMVAKLTNSCPPLRFQSGSAADTLTQLIRRNQLKLDTLTDRGDSFVLSAEGSDSNRILQLIYQIACYGYGVDSIEIERLDKSARFNVILEIKLVD